MVSDADIEDAKKRLICLFRWSCSLLAGLYKEAAADEKGIIDFGQNGNEMIPTENDSDISGKVTLRLI